MAIDVEKKAKTLAGVVRRCFAIVCDQYDNGPTHWKLFEDVATHERVLEEAIARAVADAKREQMEADCKAVSAYCARRDCGLLTDTQGFRSFLIGVLKEIRAAFAATEPRDAAKDDARELRECVNDFAAGMLAKLMTPKNRAKGDRQGWLSMSIQALEDRLEVETYELHEAIANGKSVEEIEDEARDVANFAMMIADKARELGLDGAA